MITFTRALALRLIAIVILAASVAAYTQSYHGLVDWAVGHHEVGIWAVTWPLLIDSFPIVGELFLFVAAVDGAPLHTRVWAWLATLAGLAASLAGNVWHLADVGLADRLTFAAPPLAAATALGIGLGILKRSMKGGRAPAMHWPRPHLPGWLHWPAIRWPSMRWLGFQDVDEQPPAAVVQPVDEEPARPVVVPVVDESATVAAALAGRPAPTLPDMADFQPIVDEIAARLRDGKVVGRRTVADEHPGMSPYKGAQLIALAKAANANGNGTH